MEDEKSVRHIDKIMADAKEIIDVFNRRFKVDVIITGTYIEDTLAVARIMFKNQG